VSHDDLRLLIDGEWLDGAGRTTRPVINPATEVILGSLPLATPADLDRALDAAQRAWPSWRALAPVQRGRILRARHLLRSRTGCPLATLEGKTLTRPYRGRHGGERLRWARRRGGGLTVACCTDPCMTVVREPVGRWRHCAMNFPLGNPARKLAALPGAYRIPNLAEEAAGPLAPQPRWSRRRAAGRRVWAIRPQCRRT
jgi:succinate-semialdehyde dehydrogenase/glutarate-semialdehyde dehydrogenase